MLLVLAHPGVSIILCRRLPFWQHEPLTFLLWFQLFFLLFHLGFSFFQCFFSVFSKQFLQISRWILLILYKHLLLVTLVIYFSVLVFKMNITELWWFEGFWLGGFSEAGRGSGRWRESHLPGKVLLLIMPWRLFLGDSDIITTWSNLYVLFRTK